MKIATWNVNSVRRRMPLLLEWLSLHQPDVMCLQETKVSDDDFPVDAIREAGYIPTFRGMKAYSGVATLSRRQPDSVQHGFHDGPDNEDTRVLQTTIGGVRIINTYVPQGQSITSEKYQYKLRWFSQIKQYFEQNLDPLQPAIWTGDMNVAPEPIDVYHPDRRVNDPDFHIDARLAYKDALSWGFTDVFRILHPDRVQYTYWDYFRNALQNNWGWRIDHIVATPLLAPLCRVAEVDMTPRNSPVASDHTVMWAEFDYQLER